MFKCHRENIENIAENIAWKINLLLRKIKLRREPATSIIHVTSEKNMCVLMCHSVLLIV